MYVSIIFSYSSSANPGHRVVTVAGNYRRLALFWPLVHHTIWLDTLENFLDICLIQTNFGTDGGFPLINDFPSCFFPSFLFLINIRALISGVVRNLGDGGVPAGIYIVSKAYFSFFARGYSCWGFSFSFGNIGLSVKGLRDALYFRSLDMCFFFF